MESLALTRKYGERWYEALAGEFLGSLAREEGAYHHAQQYMREALAIFRQQGDPMMISHVLTDLGRIRQTFGEVNEAEKLLRESLEIARALDCRFGMGAALDVLGQIACARACHEEALALFTESADLFLEIGDTYRLAQVFNHQGMNYLSFKDAARAKNAFQKALEISYESGLIPIALDALTGLTALGIHQKTSQEALELVIYILQHPASAQETKDLAAQLQVELEARLPKHEIEAARLRAGSKSLDEIVGQFLAGV